MAQITDLYIYPVKSLKGIALKEAHTGIRGFRYDREWMITDSIIISFHNVKLSQWLP